jgi:hypothetical protein
VAIFTPKNLVPGIKSHLSIKEETHSKNSTEKCFIINILIILNDPHSQGGSISETMTFKTFVEVY